MIFNDFQWFSCIFNDFHVFWYIYMPENPRNVILAEKKAPAAALKTSTELKKYCSKLSVITLVWKLFKTPIEKVKIQFLLQTRPWGPLALRRSSSSSTLSSLLSTTAPVSTYPPIGTAGLAGPHVPCPMSHVLYIYVAGGRPEAARRRPEAASRHLRSKWRKYAGSRNFRRKLRK